MKSATGKAWCFSFVALGFVCSVSVEMQAALTYEKDVVVVSCSRGRKRGQYIYATEEDVAVGWCLSDREPGLYIYHAKRGGYSLKPRCFGIRGKEEGVTKTNAEGGKTKPEGQNEGAIGTDGKSTKTRPKTQQVDVFYLPEANRLCRIRLHMFDPAGKLIGMLTPEGRCDGITAMAVDRSGDIYLAVRDGELDGIYIARYDRNGRLLNRFGPQGSLTQEDLRKDRYRYRSEKYFYSVSALFVMKNGELFVIIGQFVIGSSSAPPPSDTYRFNGRTGQMLEKVKRNESLPPEIAATRQKLTERWTALREAERRQGKKSVNHIAPQIGPDGHFYYMAFRPPEEKLLEIHKVTFSD